MSENTKSPEQIAAEQKLQAEVEAAKAKKAAEEKAAAEKSAKAAEDKVAAEKKAAAALAAKKKAAGENHFLKGQDVYKILLPKIIIPDLGERTALELMVDEDAQEALLQSNSGAIKKMA